VLWATYLIALSTFVKSFKDVYRAVLLAHEYFGLEAVSLLIERIALLAFGALALVAGQGLIGLCVVFVVVRLVDLAVIAAIVRVRIGRIPLGFDFPFLKGMVKTSMAIAAYYIALNVYNYIDTVMLSALRNDTEVGWYGASYKIYEGLLLLPVILATVFMPRLSRFFKENLAGFRDLLGKGLKYSVTSGLAIAVNGYFLAGFIILACFGEEYSESIASFQILLLGIPFVFGLNFLQTTMIAMDQQMFVLKVTVSGLLLNVLLNVVLIPQWGHLGAASTTAVVECLVFFVLLLRIYADDGALHALASIARPFAALLVSLGLTLGLLRMSPGVYALIVIDLVFVILLFLTGVLRREEVSAVLDLVLRRGTQRPPSPPTS